MIIDNDNAYNRSSSHFGGPKKAPWFGRVEPKAIHLRLQSFRMNFICYNFRIFCTVIPLDKMQYRLERLRSFILNCQIPGVDVFVESILSHLDRRFGSALPKKFNDIGRW